MAELTEYEKQREARVLRNNELLRAFELPQAAQALAEAVSKAKAKSQRFSSPAEGLRRSKRIQTSESLHKPMLDCSGSGSAEGSGSDGDAPCGMKLASSSNDRPLGGEPAHARDEEEYEPDEESDGSDGDENEEFEDMQEGSKPSGRKPSGRNFQQNVQGRASRRQDYDSTQGRQRGIEALSCTEASAMASAPVQDGPMDEDEAALQQAIALSLEASPRPLHLTPPDPPGASAALPSHVSRGAASTSRQAREENTRGDCGAGVLAKPQRASNRGTSKKKRKAQARLMMEPHEVEALFSALDKRRQGFLTPSDLAQAAEAHNLFWGEPEISDMISLFSLHENLQLDLKAFTKLVGEGLQSV